MSTTTITGTINGVNNTALANKWITFRLVQLGTDSVASVTVAQSVDSVQTDANGGFSIDIWNNGDSGKKSILEITIEGSKAEYVIIPIGEASIELWNLIENYSVSGANPQFPSLFAPIDNPTFTGTVNTSATGIDFNPEVEGNGGELSWNDQEKTLNLTTGSDNVTVQVGQEVILYVRNNSGVQLVDGQVVGISGSQGNNPTIQLVQADTIENARKTIGVVTQIIPNNSNGFVTLIGKVRDLVLDDGTYSEGDVVYLSDTVAGGITNVKPAIVVELGHVLATSTGGNTNGVLEVQINNESAVYELEQQVPHNTDSVIICNQGDNIQDKLNEAALLMGGIGGTLLVMAGQYGDLSLTNDNIQTNIIGVGNPTIGNIIDEATFASTNATYKDFTCGDFTMNLLDGNIENITTDSFVLYQNNSTGTIKNVNAATIYVENNNGTVDNVNATGNFITSNVGVIKNCSAGGKFEFALNGNNGIIDNCHSNGTDRGFGGYIGSLNSGTIKNCTAKGNFSFGQQTADGVTENCIGVDQAFIGDTSQVSGNIIEGTYRNCKGGNKSFLGQNTSTSAVKECRANYINCTAGVNSFCFVNTAGAETHFFGTAINCTSGLNGFCKASDGNTKILAGAVIENCTGGDNSFASTSLSTNEGTILRCRTSKTGVDAFKATGTGKVRLCLDGDFDEVNLG
jgi:hypothetical protein